jgi:hypothetical protein
VNEKLNAQECQILIEALDAWINKDFGGDMLSSFLGAMMVKGESEKAAYLAEEAKHRAKATEARKLREEQAIILKAKLLAMRDAIDVGSLMKERAP